MEELLDYFDSIGAQVNKETCSLEGKDFLEVLRELYDTVGSVDLPYGIICNLDLAIKISASDPFSQEWFVFGGDNYFSYWLCYKGENEEGHYFTYWDRESGMDIEPPIWDDLLTFLKEVEEDSKEEW